MASGDEDQTPGFVRISDFEFAAGWVPGYADDAPLDAEDVALTAGPVQVLERLLLEALLEPPCIIGFSGGRDSSALLAVAVQVARREGLDLPVPVTKTYPDVPATDETDWQELVIRWLGVDKLASTRSALARVCSQPRANPRDRQGRLLCRRGRRRRDLG
jgi:hypothetical protein